MSVQVGQCGRAVEEKVQPEKGQSFVVGLEAP